MGTRMYNLRPMVYTFRYLVSIGLIGLLLTTGCGGGGSLGARAASIKARSVLVQKQPPNGLTLYAGLTVDIDGGVLHGTIATPDALTASDSIVIEDVGIAKYFINGSSLSGSFVAGGFNYASFSIGLDHPTPPTVSSELAMSRFTSDLALGMVSVTLTRGATIYSGSAGGGKFELTTPGANHLGLDVAQITTANQNQTIIRKSVVVTSNENEIDIDFQVPSTISDPLKLPQLVSVSIVAAASSALIDDKANPALASLPLSGTATANKFTLVAAETNGDSSQIGHIEPTLNSEFNTLVAGLQNGLARIVIVTQDSVGKMSTDELPLIRSMPGGQHA